MYVYMGVHKWIYPKAFAMDMMRHKPNTNTLTFLSYKLVTIPRLKIPICPTI